MRDILEEDSVDRRSVLKGMAAAGAIGMGVGVTGCLGGGGSGGGGGGSMTIFHAGSLASPFEDAETEFESQFSANVTREAKGSVASTKKITEQGRKGSALGVSDFRLLRDLLLPEYGDWYSVFATNAMTLVYNEDSAGAEEMGTDTWWEVLQREDVSFAHSDPAVDPNGYRSVMSMQLGAEELDGERLYDEATAQALIDKAQIPSGTETTLLAQMESGELDYVFGYVSEGASHDVQTVDMGRHVDLSKATQKYAEHYAKAEVNAGGETFTGAPIAYGLTVPSVAPSPELGAKWVEFMVTEPGRQVLRDNGFNPVETPVVPASAEDSVPERVMQHAEARETLGPMEL